MTGTFRPDRGGLLEILNSQDIAATVNATAHAIASNAEHATERGTVLSIKVDEYSTDRRAASVTIAHPAGKATQAKHGTLTKAAAAIGLEVTAK